MREEVQVEEILKVEVTTMAKLMAIGKMYL